MWISLPNACVLGRSKVGPRLALCELLLFSALTLFVQKNYYLLLAIVSACTAIGAFNWLSDPDTSVVSFTQSLWNHLFFTLSALILVILCCLGIHKRVIAPSIITSRTRAVLSDFNMSCDDTGKLILRPRPTIT